MSVLLAVVDESRQSGDHYKTDWAEPGQPWGGASRPKDGLPDACSPRCVDANEPWSILRPFLPWQSLT
jgi:hypothetical protein